MKTEMLVHKNGRPFGSNSIYGLKMATDSRIIDFYKKFGNDIHYPYLRAFLDELGYTQYTEVYSGEWFDVKLKLV